MLVQVKLKRKNVKRILLHQYDVTLILVATEGEHVKFFKMLAFWIFAPRFSKRVIAVEHYIR